MFRGAYSRKRLRELYAFWGRQERMDRLFLLGLIEPLERVWIVISVEEIGRRYLQCPRNLKEFRCADTIRTTLVFLDLLKSQPDSACQNFLADPEKFAPHANPPADINIDGIGRFIIYVQ